MSSWKRKQTSNWFKTGFFSQFASWKRNYNKYLLKKFVDSEFEIGESIWWTPPKIVTAFLPGFHETVLHDEAVIEPLRPPFFKRSSYFTDRFSPVLRLLLKNRKLLKEVFKIKAFPNFSYRFLNPNIFFQFELQLF